MVRQAQLHFLVRPLDKKMNQVLKNTHDFVNVLCMARCEAVQQWDEDTFRRAYKWARYFEEVHCKLKNKPLLSDKLDKYLANFNKSEDIFLGNEELTFQKLSKSQQILRKCLLQNPHLSESQFAMVLELYGVERIEKDVSNECIDEFSQDLFTLTKTKVTIQVLLDVKEKLDQAKMSCNVPQKEITSEVAIKAVAKLVQRYIYHQITCSGQSTERMKSALHDKLWIISQQKSGLKIILEFLLLPPCSAAENQVECVVQATDEQPNQLVLQWLLENVQSVNFKQELFSQPCSLLSQVAAVYISFFRVYFSHLIHWGNSMIQEIQHCSNDSNMMTTHKTHIWRHETMDNECFSYKSLLDHFGCLVLAASHTRAICLQALQTLVTDADAKGISQHFETKPQGIETSVIWRDVYSALETG